MARLYTDENFSVPCAEILKQLGHDVLTCVQSGRAGQSIDDERVLAYAISADRIIVTWDRLDYMRLHKKNKNHPGIVICTFDKDSNALAQRIHAVLTSHVPHAGQLMRVYRPG